MKYFLKRNGKVFGPVTPQQLENGIKSKTIKGTDEISVSKTEGFTSLKNVYKSAIKGEWEGVGAAEVDMAPSEPVSDDFWTELLPSNGNSPMSPFSSQPSVISNDAYGQKSLIKKLQEEKLKAQRQEKKAASLKKLKQVGVAGLVVIAVCVLIPSAYLISSAISNGALKGSSKGNGSALRAEKELTKFEAAQLLAGVWENVRTLPPEEDVLTGQMNTPKSEISTRVYNFAPNEGMNWVGNVEAFHGIIDDDPHKDFLTRWKVSEVHGNRDEAFITVELSKKALLGLGPEKEKWLLKGGVLFSEFFMSREEYAYKKIKAGVTVPSLKDWQMSKKGK